MRHLLQTKYGMLSVKETLAEDTMYVSVARECCSVLEGIGPVDNPRLLLKFSRGHEVSYTFQVHFTSAESGDYSEVLVKAKLEQLLPGSGYILCPGLRSYDLKFKSKNLRVWPNPLKRIDSKTCALFHVPQNSKLHPHHSLYNMCASCKKLANAISKIQKEMIP